WSDHPARTPRLLGLLAAALVAVSGTEARAVPTNVNRIPNGIQFDCLNCHRDLNGGPRNAFMGMDFEMNEQRWAMIFDLDSDGDGQTNGEELGDPCGVWPKRRTPTRTTDISNPSVRGSRSSGLTPIDCEALRAEVRRSSRRRPTKAGVEAPVAGPMGSLSRSRSAPLRFGPDVDVFTTARRAA
ncbi:MAG: hypothetical protein AAFU79_18785, partial [Myxococcota bacterium]